MGRLSKVQEKIVRQYAGKMPIQELAIKVGTSNSNLDRWAYYNKVDINWLSYKPREISQVLNYYEKHGKVKTQKKYPQFKVRSIVERYKSFKPRCIKWTNEQIIELAKMGGLVSFKAQAKYFNRPRANAGSIRSVWMKKFLMYPSSLHGLPRNHAKHISNGKLKYIRPCGNDRLDNPIEFRSLALWCDLEKNLKEDTPDFIVEAIKTMANFQRWLFKSEDPKKEILKLIKDREKGIESFQSIQKTPELSQLTKYQHADLQLNIMDHKTTRL